MPITTLLFDLDDTLLDNDTERFVPAYLRLLSDHLAPLVPPQVLVRELLNGVRAMLSNEDPDLTLQQAFERHFYGAAGISAEQVRPQIDAFYGGLFGQLRGETTVVPAAREVMAWSFASGREVAIASNAVYPDTAIRQRLAWAGVGAEEFPYALITTFEFMHFAKPSPEYYAEVLAWLDRRPEEVLMVGNDWVNDVVPAQAAALAAFWVAPLDAQPPADSADPAGQGQLADFLRWARDAQGLDSMAALPITPRAVRAQQMASPAVLGHVAAALTTADWRRRPVADPTAWSPADIACHLRDVEIEVSLPRLRQVLREPNPFISAVDSDRWATARDYRSQDGPAALTAFAAARRETIALMDGLSPQDWQRPARHAIFGPTNLQELVSLTNEHDRLHLRQLRETVRPPGVAMPGGTGTSQEGANRIARQGR